MHNGLLRSSIYHVGTRLRLVPNSSFSRWAIASLGLPLQQLFISQQRLDFLGQIASAWCGNSDLSSQSKDVIKACVLCQLHTANNFAADQE